MSLSELTEAAARLRRRGFAICWVAPAEKRPTKPAWNLRSAEPGDCPGADWNLGVQTGRLSGDLVCIDLDAPEAVELAAQFLPPTAMVEGRPGKPRSHWWYKVTDIPEALTARPNVSGGVGGPRTRRFTRPDGSELLAFKGTGTQCVVPPSLHDSGERRQWDDPDGEPSVLPCLVLFDAVVALARACGWEPKDERPRARRGVRRVKAPRPPGDAHTVEPDAEDDADDEPRDVPNLPLLPDNVRYERAAAYLAATPGAISGHGGHNATYRAARVLTNDFALSREDALTILTAWNATCRPPWSADELRHKVDSAVAADPDALYGSKAPADPVNNPGRLAREYLSDVTIHFHKGTCYVYDDHAGGYREFGPHELEARVAAHVQGRFDDDYRIRAAQHSRAVGNEGRHRAGYTAGDPGADDVVGHSGTAGVAPDDGAA